MMNYNLHFEKLCKELSLGELITSPEELSGGLMHRMFALETTSGKYAVKALNPSVISRPKARRNTIVSEQIARIAAQNVNAITAILFDYDECSDEAIVNIDFQNYMVFPWCGGKHVFGDDITLKHCEQMGKALAKIHNTDYSPLGLEDTYSSDEPIPDWKGYLEKGIQANAVWAAVLRDNIDLLYEYSQKVQTAADVLSVHTVITHMDLEPKNTLWQGDIPYIIDWESAGFVNLYHDLVESAVYWSKDNNGKLIKDKFISFINGYKSYNDDLSGNWDIVLDKGFSGLLGWLEYSLKRSLWIECSDVGENQMGTEHVFATIQSIIRYSHDKERIRDWLREA